MINTVRNTVLSVLNKNNYGYLSPSDFNLFAKQAQLDIFESYFLQYNAQVNAENMRNMNPRVGSGTGIADIKKAIEEAIDVFSSTNGLSLSSGNIYNLPSLTTTGDDYYLLNKVLIYEEILKSSTTSSYTADNIITDLGGLFLSAGISAGDIVAVENGGVQYTSVVSVDSDTTITVLDPVFTTSPLSYSIYRASTRQSEAEQVTHSKITMLNNSIYTSPTLTYPSYTQEDVRMTVFPSSIDDVGRVIAQYYRYPKDPKWTYVSLTNGEPMFDQSQPDYQDFELPLEEENNLILKILQYAGVSIREGSVYQFGNYEENNNQGQAPNIQ
jgi:hypothetical protein